MNLLKHESREALNRLCLELRRAQETENVITQAETAAEEALAE